MIFDSKNQRGVKAGRKNAQRFSARGYSLVEVLIAITVLLIALVGPLTIAYTGLKRANFSGEQTAAIFLAQEGVEAIVKLREDSALSAGSFSDFSALWSGISSMAGLCPMGSSNYCGVTVSDNGNISFSQVYQCGGDNCRIRYAESARVPFKQGSSATGADTIYTRRLQFRLDDIDHAYVEVRSEVSWSGGTSQSVVLDTYVYNTYYEPAP